jgi:hypothetical protein
MLSSFLSEVFMNYLTRSLTIVTIFLLSLGSSRVSAQDEITAPPKAAARTSPILPQTTDNNEGQSASDQGDLMQPDSRPLTGIQTLTLGSEQFRHSYWVPGFQYGNTIQSMTLVGTAPVPGWSSDNYLAGNFSLLSTWSRSQLAVNYSGGGFLSTSDALGNGYFHELGITQTFTWGRLNIALLDQFTYLPEALFGFGGAIRLGVPGIGTSLAPTSPDFVSNLVPNQSILASTGTRYSNASAAEITYALDPRSSVTMAGSYGFLHFLEPGNFDGAQSGANLGYNYLLTNRDSIGVLYRFTSFQYPGLPQAIGSHVAGLAYGRKITARLALQLTAGPEIAFFRVPVNGQTSEVLPFVSTSLVYGVPRGQFSFGYTQGVSGGSGLLAGSNSNQLMLSANHRVGRLWTVMGSLSYARNRSLASSSAPASRDFGAWVATTGLSYPFGPNASMSFGYTALIQTSSQPCMGPCTTNSTQHEISLGFQWNTRPFVIR